MILGNTFLPPWSVLSALVPGGTRSNVFEEIYTVFLLLGTIVGIVVVLYMLQKAYKYRASASPATDDIDRPELGELPTGGGGGRKLFVSFGLSAIIVISLITWTYFTLLYVEDPNTDGPEDSIEIEVIGHQFYWEFVYPNGYSTDGTLRVPADTRINIEVTSADTFHNFGVPELRAKADAIPGETTSTWFMADEPGSYAAHCYELCGGGHSYMDATVEVLSPEEFEQWYEQTSNASATSPTAPLAAVPQGV
jgi:cytochrome c oxidase subunit 2